MKRLESARNMAYNFSNGGQKASSGRPSGMDDCYELLDVSLYQLNDVLTPKAGADREDISTWLSAALTNQVSTPYKYAHTVCISFYLKTSIHCSSFIGCV
jgi:Plant invertase/pectin methylesterase inhibitor